jgi:hypothetical protein
MNEECCKPTIYVAITGNSRSGESSVQRAILAVASAFGATPIDQLVDAQNTEATLAVTDSVTTALRWLKETERTIVLISYFYASDQESFEAFARRYPNRVRVLSYIGGEGETALVPTLLQLIASTKGTHDENPAG